MDDNVLECSGNPINKLKELKERESSFRVTSTTNYTVFELDNGIVYRYCRDHKKKKFLGLVTALKSEINNRIKEGFINPKQIPSYNTEEIPYYMYNRHVFYDCCYNKEPRQITDCTGMDISKAYYQTAYSLGYISEKFYEKCLNIDKSQRLQLIGALATRKDISEYEYGKEVAYRSVSNTVHTNIWFHLCKYVGNCMYQFARSLGDSFVYYWVDGIVFTNDALSKAREFAQFAGIEYGLYFTEENIPFIEIDNDIMYVHKEGKVKQFSLPRNSDKLG